MSIHHYCVCVCVSFVVCCVLCVYVVFSFQQMLSFMPIAEQNIPSTKFRARECRKK